MAPLVMGILNVTPDSFSDGGNGTGVEDAVVRARQMLAEGADLVDIGGESTRPGANPVPVEQELERILPVVRALSSECRISVDTRNLAAGEVAVEAGATVVNDVSANPELIELAARHKVGYVLMHAQGDPRTMQINPTYDDVVGEVYGYLREQAAACRRMGVEELWVDPGFGFGKTLQHNLDLVAALPELVKQGDKVLVGVSRKGFVGRISGGTPVTERAEGSMALAAWAMACGVDVVRVHDVAVTATARERLKAGNGVWV